MIAQSAEVASADSSALLLLTICPPHPGCLRQQPIRSEYVTVLQEAEHHGDSEQIPSVGVYAIPKQGAVRVLHHDGFFVESQIPGIKVVFCGFDAAQACYSRH